MVIRTFVSGDPGVGFQGPRGVMRKGVPGGQEGHLRGPRDSTGRCKKGDQQIYSHQGGQGAGKGRFQKLLWILSVKGVPPLPPTPLTDNHFSKKILAERGSTPPPP